MIYLKLFLTFLEIGAVSFGGGYGMMSLMREKMLAFGWITEEELLNMIAVAESTPGPIAVNLATFIGSSQGGAAGALLATLGVVLPSFIVILLIASLVRGFLEYAGVKAFLGGIRPCVVALILTTAFTMFLGSFFSIKTLESAPCADFIGITIFLTVAVFAFFFKKIKKKKPSPILLIIISAFMGMVLYGI